MGNEITTMKVLNVAQPNAHNIIFSGKNVENRSGGCNFRGTIAIYGSKTVNKRRFEGSDIKIEDCSLGAIIGFVDLVECITESQVTDGTKKWFHGPYGYVFENVVALEKPIEVTPPKGAVIWWPLTGEDLQKCLSQVSLANIKPIVNVAPNKDVPKNSPRAKLTPSAKLAAIIGPEAVSFRQAFNKLADYIDEKELFDPETNIVKSDKTLKVLFGKDQMTADEFNQFLSDNLE